MIWVAIGGVVLLFALNAWREHAAHARAWREERERFEHEIDQYARARQRRGME